EMTQYLSDHTDEYNSTDHFLKDGSDGELMVTGWIAGEVLSRAVSVPEVLENNTKFQRSLFDQRRYKIDDLVIGDFGDDCSDIADSNGVVCRCNQGGRAVYVKHFVEDYAVERIIDGTLLLDPMECYAKSLVMLSPFGLIMMVMTDRHDAVRAMEDITYGTTAAIGNQLILGSFHFMSARAINTPVSDASAALTKELEVRYVDCVVGVLPKYLLNTKGITFIDPVPLQSHVNRFRRREIHLSPTLEQEFFVVAQYLGNTTVANAHAVIRSDGAAAVADVLRRSLVTFNGSLLSSALLGGGDALESHLPRDGDVFVVGLAAADVAVVAGHLAKHSGVRVFVLFTEFSLLYGEFVAAFNGSAAAGRLVFATSLPHWADESTTSETVQKFHAAVEEKTKWTPLALRSFATVSLMRSVAARMDKVGAKHLADFFYTNVMVTVDDMHYGSFFDNVDCGDEAPTEHCGSNYGDPTLLVWSMARALDPTVPAILQPTSQVIFYVEGMEATTQTNWKYMIGAASVGTALFALAVIIVVILCCGSWRDARDNNNAPKEPTDPVTLVFTDIESSTA
ncbi:receptor-type adenylate cyclase, partial [Trypanosoma grayi]|uniref:receptor-type adenylate cyclase n=1 Tax=Trypanosoma grayi TaxID=71804 RepID=UPI0004F41A82